MQLLLKHSIVGRDQLTNFEFDPDKPYRACLLCGVVFQTALHRQLGNTYLERCHLYRISQEWAKTHARVMHTEREHEMHRASKLAMTPEAANVLAPYGLAPVSDMVLSDEHSAAAGEAPRAPVVDAEF